MVDETEARVLGEPEAIPEGVFEQALQEAFDRPHDPGLADLLQWDDQDDVSWGDEDQDAWDDDVQVGAVAETGLAVDPDDNPDQSSLHAAGLEDEPAGHDDSGLGHHPDHSGLDLDHGMDQNVDEGTGLDAGLDAGLGLDTGSEGLEIGEHDAFGVPGDDQWTGLGDGADWH